MKHKICLLLLASIFLFTPGLTFGEDENKNENENKELIEKLSNVKNTTGIEEILKDKLPRIEPARAVSRAIKSKKFKSSEEALDFFETKEFKDAQEEDKRQYELWKDFDYNIFLDAILLSKSEETQKILVDFLESACPRCYDIKNIRRGNSVKKLLTNIVISPEYPLDIKIYIVKNNSLSNIPTSNIYSGTIFKYFLIKENRNQPIFQYVIKKIAGGCNDPGCMNFIKSIFDDYGLDEQKKIIESMNVVPESEEFKEQTDFFNYIISTDKYDESLKILAKESLAKMKASREKYQEGQKQEGQKQEEESRNFNPFREALNGSIINLNKLADKIERKGIKNDEDKKQIEEFVESIGKNIADIANRTPEEIAKEKENVHIPVTKEEIDKAKQEYEKGKGRIDILRKHPYRNKLPPAKGYLPSKDDTLEDEKDK